MYEPLIADLYLQSDRGPVRSIIIWLKRSKSLPRRVSFSRSTQRSFILDFRGLQETAVSKIITNNKLERRFIKYKIRFCLAVYVKGVRNVPFTYFAFPLIKTERFPKSLLFANSRSRLSPLNLHVMYSVCGLSIYLKLNFMVELSVQ